MRPDRPAPSLLPTPPAAPHVCPWWLGPLLANPLRRLVESPARLLAPFVTAGMTVVEPGCGMGFFTLPLARLVGPAGTVVAVDLQPRMIDGLLRRARRAGVTDRIRPVVCSETSLNLDAFEGRADLVVAMHVLHEIPDRLRFFRQVHAVLVPGGRVVIVEPAGHVTASGFDESLSEAAAAGFEAAGSAIAGRSLSAMLVKPHVGH